MGGSESSLRKRPAWLHKRTRPPTKTKLQDLHTSIREYLLSLNSEQLNYLASTYSTLSEERVYYTRAMRARPTPQSIYQDFSDLLDYKWNTDLELQLPAANFLAHKTLLMARSGWFSSHLKSNSIKLTILEVLSFSELLRWVYTGEGAVNPQFTYLNLSNCTLVESMEQLYNTRVYADCLLIWSSNTSQPCHVCVLSARSPLLRSLLSKKKSLVLDQGIVPYKYSSTILYYIYTDRLELSLIGEQTIPPPFQMQQQSTPLNTSQDTSLTHLFELYYCSQFLELESLTHSIESMIEASISHSNWPRVTAWASESHSSSYIRRCCLLYLQENWWCISTTTTFYNLKLELIEELVKSDFTQCPESELVDSVLRWGQYNSIQLPASILNSMRLDYITNTALLKQVTRGMQSPSLLMQSRPRYWGPIHEQLVGMVGAGGLDLLVGDYGQNIIGQEEDLAEGGGGEEILIEPELFSQLVQKYEGLQSEAPPSENIRHWMRLECLREAGLPDCYEKCLISSCSSPHHSTHSHDEQGAIEEEESPNQQQHRGRGHNSLGRHSGRGSNPGVCSLRRRPAPPPMDLEHPLPDIASNIIDPIVNLDLGDRFKH